MFKGYASRNNTKLRRICEDMTTPVRIDAPPSSASSSLLLLLRLV